MANLFLNIKGSLIDLATPRVMGIINATPDSFFAGSRAILSSEIQRRLESMLDDGADIIDLGAYSSRPGADDVPEEEEYSRLASALEIIRRIAPEIPLSIDTFRASVARRCVLEWNADIINDISGGNLDSRMFETVAELRVAYILMHMRGTPADMQQLTQYRDVTADVISDLARKAFRLRELGVNDIIIDPGFGFAKTTEQNFRLLAELSQFVRMGLPVLAGLSRKSMIWRTLGISPEESLEGTVALNMAALERGASILRVHDVRAAVHTRNLFLNLRNASF